MRCRISLAKLQVWNPNPSRILLTYLKFGNKHFCAEGYSVRSVGLNEATMKKYNREQERQDMLEDKLITKEDNDPFKGSR